MSAACRGFKNAPTVTTGGLNSKEMGQSASLFMQAGGFTSLLRSVFSHLFFSQPDDLNDPRLPFQGSSSWLVSVWQHHFCAAAQNSFRGARDFTA